MTVLCECGCGEQVTVYYGKPCRFVRGHWRKANRILAEDRGYTTPCWIWQLAYNIHGYGVVKHKGLQTNAHRAYYEQAHGPIPEGFDVDHLCRVRACVNPDHLEAVTRRENLLRGETVAAMNAAKTHCPQGHSYSPENTIVLAGTTWRRCRECTRQYKRRLYHARNPGSVPRFPLLEVDGTRNDGLG